MRPVAPNIRFKIEMSLDELPVDETARGTVDAIITVRLEQPEPKAWILRCCVSTATWA